MKVQQDEMFVARVGKPELVASLHRLVELAALSDTGQASVAAKVVLGTYNGDAFPLDLTEIGRLDTALFEDAINVIRLRVQHHVEPHNFYVDGDALFQEMIDVWGLRPEEDQ